MTMLWHCIVPQETVLRESVSITEVQHLYDEQGRLVFDQLVLWGEDDHVIYWRLIKCDADIPRRDWQTGGYVTTFIDGERVRSVQSLAFRERWEQWDVELADREVLPKEKRRGLRSR